MEFVGLVLLIIFLVGLPAIVIRLGYIVIHLREIKKSLEVLIEEVKIKK